MKAKKIELPQTEEFQNLINLLAVFTEATNQLAKIQNQTNEELLEILDEHKPDYAAAQEVLTKAEAALEAIALTHPEWFTKKKSIKTAYGTVKLTSSTKLEIPNEEASIILTELACERELQAAQKEQRPPAFTVDSLIRQEKSLNKEALEKLDDATLKILRVKRVKKESFSVTAATLEMGKAVEEAVTDETAKQEAA